MISIEFIGLPYLEVIPSISIARGNIMFSWLVWGIFIKWGDYD